MNTDRPRYVGTGTPTHTMNHSTPKEQAIRQEIVQLTERTRRAIQELGEMMLELVDITTAQRRELETRQQQPDREHWQRHTY